MDSSRVRRAARRFVGGGDAALEGRVADLEREVQELRRTNLRLAELTDVVEELLVPIAAQDRERIEAALARYPRDL